MEDEVRGAFALYASSMERGLALLSGIGNVAPMVGFLGTVVGMIGAFASIAAATTVNAKVVAVGIQMALVTTAGGLIVAAPTLTFFYFITHVIQARYSRAEELASAAAEKLPRLSDKLCQDQ
jgi:biopolymer transport protein ExbB